MGGAAEGADGPVAVQPNGTAIATLVINASAAPGPRSVTVAGVNIITQANAFTVITGTRTLTLDSIFPPSGVAGAGVSVTATGFEIGVTAPALTVTLTHQGGGAPVNVPGSTTGTTLTRQISFTCPQAPPEALIVSLLLRPGMSAVTPFRSRSLLPRSRVSARQARLKAKPCQLRLPALILTSQTCLPSTSAGITVNSVVFNSAAVSRPTSVFNQERRPGLET